MRGETRMLPCDLHNTHRISIHSPHARGDRHRICSRCRYRISIHSPHARGDGHQLYGVQRPYHFNPLPSCEGRPERTPERDETGRFQSTPLMRGETSWRRSGGSCADYFNPLPSCEGRLRGRGQADHARTISIHSPHARGDSISLQKSIRIYVSLHNKTMIHRFSGLYKPLFAAQSPIFGVRSPRKSHDSFTFARLSEGSGITP